MSQPQTSPLIADALERIQAKIAERRINGEYPAGLEEQLDRWFQEFLRTAHDAPRSNLDALRDRLEGLNGWPGFATARIEYTSRNPASRMVHRAAGAAVRRQTQAVLAQSQEFAEQVQGTLNEVGEVLQQLARHEGSDPLSATLAGILDRLAIVDQLVVRVNDLERRLAEAEAPTIDD